MWPRVAFVSVCAVLVACGEDRRVQELPPPSVPPRVVLLTDAQFMNAVRDLLHIEPRVLQTPGSTPHQLVADIVAVEPSRLVQYRMAAEAVARDVTAETFGCSDDACARTRIEGFASRAFRRPLETDELDRLFAIYALDGGTRGFALVVETVLQAPSFLYRTELGSGDPSTPLTSFELAASLSFYLLDSVPDDELWSTALDGSILDDDVYTEHVDRLLASDRVRERLTQVVLDWLEAHRIFDAVKDTEVYPELTRELQDSMYGETRRFVDDVLWKRDGSLRELLTSSRTFVDARLAPLYDLDVESEQHTQVHLDDSRRSGILTQAGILTMLASARRESIIARGRYVHRTFLCTPEPGRPPFAAIAEVSNLTSELSESQFAHYRAQHLYCSSCHRSIDPPGRALGHYDGLGRWQEVDEILVPVETDAVVEIDGRLHSLDGAIDLAHALASSRQVAACVVEHLSHHAFSTRLDPAGRALLVQRFYDSGRDITSIFRAIALSPAFRQREASR